MARRADLVGFLKGLESIGKALVDKQSGDIQQVWKNSSLRSTTGELRAKTEEAVSDTVNKQAGLQVQ